MKWHLRMPSVDKGLNLFHLGYLRVVFLVPCLSFYILLICGIIWRMHWLHMLMMLLKCINLFSSWWSFHCFICEQVYFKNWILVFMLGHETYPSKSQSIAISRSWTAFSHHPSLIIGGSSVSIIKSIKLLGVTLDNKLTLEDHLLTISLSYFSESWPSM